MKSVRDIQIKIAILEKDLASVKENYPEDHPDRQFVIDYIQNVISALIWVIEE